MADDDPSISVEDLNAQVETGPEESMADNAEAILPQTPPTVPRTNSPRTLEIVAGPSSPSSSPPSPTLSDSSDFETSQDMDGNLLWKVPVRGYSPRRGRWSSKYESSKIGVLKLQVITWNVDFMAPDSAGRMSTILEHLRRKVLGEYPLPTAILLQELDQQSLAVVLSNEWVREHFAVMPTDTSRWCASYGVATLVSRHINIISASMLQFTGSSMGRTALFVDLELAVPDSLVENRVARIANTHLESLPVGQMQRPLQLRAIADWLRRPGIEAGVVAGDMNIISPADEHISVYADLEDACSDSSEKTYTWGYQPRMRFPPGRLDRIFTLPGTLAHKPVEVIGKGLKTRRGMWASDHYGLKVQVKLPYEGPSCDGATPIAWRKWA